jgi:hypothetical protein
MEQGGVCVTFAAKPVVSNLPTATHRGLCGPDASNRGWLTQRIRNSQTYTAKNEWHVQLPAKIIHPVTTHTSDCNRYFTLYPSGRSDHLENYSCSPRYAPRYHGCIAYPRLTKPRVFAGSVPDRLGCWISGSSFTLVQEPSTPGNCVDQDKRAIHDDLHV